MRKTALIGSFVAGSAIALTAGFLVEQFLIGPRYALPLQAVISIDQNQSCWQDVGGIRTPFAPLNVPHTSFGGDTIVWSGKDQNKNDAVVVVQFPPQSLAGGIGTPFYFAGSGTPRIRFSSGQDSGPVTRSADGQYPFDTVTVGGLDCKNRQSMGIQVTK